MTGALLLSTTLPTVIAMGVVAETVRRVMPMQGKGGGKGVPHWHYKGKNKAVMHSHPGGHVSHRHKGLPGYGRTRATLRR